MITVVINRNDTPTLASCYCSFHSISWFREKQNKQRWADQTHTAREPQTMTSEKNGKPSGRPAWLAGPTKKQIERDWAVWWTHTQFYISNQMRQKQFTVLAFLSETSKTGFIPRCAGIHCKLTIYIYNVAYAPACTSCRLLKVHIIYIYIYNYIYLLYI